MEMNDRITETPLDENGHPLFPVMNFYENEDGNLRLALWGWDTQESVDGYGIEEIDQLIESLNDAKEHIINNNEAQGKFHFAQGDSDD